MSDEGILQQRFVDLNKAEVIEVKISRDGKRLWVDSQAGNLLRIYNIGKLILRDERKLLPLIEGENNE